MSTGGIENLLDRLATTRRAWFLAVSGPLIGGIAWLDWYLGEAVSLGALYVIPILLLSGILSRFQILSVALLCVVLRVVFNPPMTVADGILNGGFAFIAYGLIGIFASELIKSRREILRHLIEIQHQQALRITAQEQLSLLAESSPAAIFTLNEHAEILSANKATRELLGLDPSISLTGIAVGDTLPIFAEALRLDTGDDGFRTASQVQGKRCDGTPFLAQACFSTYKVEGGALRLAAIAFDSTEDTREREEQSQHQMLETNRIIAGAVAHEVRNVCSAMSVVYSNLEGLGGVRGNPDYQALGNLITGLSRLAVLELHAGQELGGNSADVRDVLNQLRILVDPAWRDEDAHIEWPELPHPLFVTADSFTLLQAFLNIVNNSLIAISSTPQKRLVVSTETLSARMHICFSDSGDGVAEPEYLFQPFRTGFGRVGLGLYISRALLRRYGGDVRHDPASTGARFIVEVPIQGVSADVARPIKHNPTTDGR